MRWAEVALWVGAALAVVFAMILYWPFRLDLSITRDSGRTRATARVWPWPFLVSVPFYHRDVPPPTVPVARWTLADLPETVERLRRMANVITSAASLGHRLIELGISRSVGRCGPTAMLLRRTVDDHVGLRGVGMFPMGAGSATPGVLCLACVR